ncbi:MAG: hypothetical protein OXL97_00735 [Chloroflexota bacterium]|nr:hypothetical protein [Chloroflexota bacterium]MDE2883669.1 hypothetical protein [Chloroflexota bacterium]
MATPTLTPTPAPSPTAGPSRDGESALLLQRAEQVGMGVIEATREGCAFLYEEGEYHSSGSGVIGGNAGRDTPYGRVARTTVEFGPGGQFRSESQSVTGMQSTLSSGGGVDSDMPAWVDEQIVSLGEMLARGRYVGESSFIGQPSLRYEMRTEGGSSSSGAAGSLFVFDYVVDNPFIRMEHQYAVLPDGSVQLERQWATSAFGVEGCGREGEAARSTGDAVAVEIGRNASDVHDDLVESIDAGCALVLTMEYNSVPQTDRMEGGDARDLLSWFVAIAGLANPENANGDDSAMGVPGGEYTYAGEAELFGLPAVRFEHSEVRASESGLTNYLNVWEFVRENPLLSRATVYGALLPDGAPGMVHRQGVSSLATDCGS